jgi:hypothetical protein
MAENQTDEQSNKLTDLNRDAAFPDLESKTNEKDLAEGRDALDSLLVEHAPDSDEAVELKQKREAELTPEQKAEKAKVEKDAADAKAKEEADKKAKEEADKAASLTEEQKAEKEKADKEAAEKKAKEEAAAKNTEEFEKIELPPHAKPATTESFAKVKMLAKQQITKLTVELQERDAKLKELESKQAEAGKLAPEVEKELSELRNFRRSMDVEASPEFKEYDSQVTANEEAILRKLKEVDVSDSSIEKIKKLGVANVDWEPVLKELPPIARRFIETKLVANEDVRAEKASALAEAKKNAEQFLKESEEKSGTSAAARKTATETHFKDISSKVAWFKKIDAPANATEEVKNQVKAHNEFMETVNKEVQEAIADDSPEMRAILALGYAQMLRLQKEVPYLKSSHETEKKKLSEEITTLKTTLKEREDFIAKIKKSSSTSLRSEIRDNKSATAEHDSKLSPSERIDALRNEVEAGS